MKGRRKAFFLIIAALFILTASFYYVFLRSAPDSAPEFPRASLIIESSNGRAHVFSVEVATTEEQHAYGLMNRRSMPQDAGMLFVFRPAQEVFFWMKNTYIPLDMLFVRADGVIVKIIADAEPLKLTPLLSGEPVVGVIEINGGEAARRGIKTGDKARSDAL